MAFAGAFALHDLRGQWRALLLPVACIAAAVAGRTAVGLLSAQATQRLDVEARTVAGADLEIAGPAAMDPARREKLMAVMPRGVRAAELLEFVTLALDPRTGKSRLVEARAVSGDYPLYGSFAVAPAGEFSRLRAGGALFAHPDLGVLIGTRPGDELRLGRSSFRLAGWVTREPGAALELFSLGPKVWMNLGDLPATGLDAAGSRINHRLLLALPAGADADANVETARVAAVAAMAGANFRVVPASRSNPQLRRFYTRLSGFLQLLLLLVFALAGLGLFTAVRSHLRSRFTTVALLRCLGATRAQITRVYFFQLLGLGAAGVLAGTAGGLLLRGLLAAQLAGLLPEGGGGIGGGIPLRPILIAALLGIAVTIGFGMMSLAELPSVQPMRLLRGGAVEIRAGGWRMAGWGLAVSALLAGVAGLELHSAGAALRFGAALTGLVLLAWGLAWLALRLAAAPGRSARGFALRYGLRNLTRHPAESAMAVAILACGALLMAALVHLRAATLAGLDRPPAQRPALFLIDVGDDQRAGVEALLRSRGAHTLWGRMVHGVLTTVNDQPFHADRADNFRGRESNLSERAELYPSESVSAGKFWSGPAPAEGPFAISVEAEYAARQGFHLGDTLEYDIGGVLVKGTISNLRRVRWTEMTPNFFVTFQPGALSEAPGGWVASVALADPAVKPALQSELAAAYPGVTPLDIAELAGRVLSIAERIDRTARLLSLFALLVGTASMTFIALDNARRRVAEIAVLKAIGARRRPLLAALAIEYGVTTLLGLSLGALGGWGLARLAFAAEFATPLGPFSLPILAMLLPLAAGVTLAALLASLRLFAIRPLAALKSI